MPSLKDFVAALQAGWFPALAALIGCSFVVFGDAFQVRYLDASPPWLLTAAVVVGVFALSILLANLAYAPVALWRRYKRNAWRLERTERIIAEVNAAPVEEISVLAYLITMGRQAFSAEFNDRRLAPLVSKGIIVKLGGTHSMLEWPYIVDDDVWRYLLENRDSLHMPEAKTMLDPFHWRNS